MSGRPAARWEIEAADRLARVAKELSATQAFGDFHLITLTNLFLLASYLYYERDESLMSDGAFDGLCKYLLDHHDELAPAGVWRVELFDRESLDAGSGNHLRGRYPHTIINLAETMLLRRLV